MKATQQDISQLDWLYAGRQPYYGELHDHSNSGPKGDGHNSLSEWKGGLAALSMDFATIVDHRQVQHMYLPEWDSSIFIGGTEPGTRIKDSKAQENQMHYNVLFSEPAQLEALLADTPEFEFTGGQDGTFHYSSFERERFCRLIDTVKRLGGFFVHPHPKQVMKSDDPLDYWFADETGLEVFYTCHQELDGTYTADNYKLWTDLLALGKRIWATAGNDEHRMPSNKALTTIFSPEKHSRAYLQQLRKGDFVCGGVGIRMCIGDTPMGGKCSFAGQRLVFSVGQFHKSLIKPGHIYRAELLSDDGVIFSSVIDPVQTACFAVDADRTCKFYRVEVFDITSNMRIAIGNPIWNMKRRMTL